MQKVILITKGKGDFWGIGLVEVIWKAITRLLNRRITAAISFHDTLHGFRSGQETGTAAPEAKLLGQLTTMREVVLFEVFLYLQKAYDAFDRERALEFLAAYGVGLRTVRLLWTYWY